VAEEQQIGVNLRIEIPLQAGGVGALPGRKAERESMTEFPDKWNEGKDG
jgi:hypothetical protein